MARSLFRSDRTAGTVKLDIDPLDALVDVPLRIQASGVEPGGELSIAAALVDDRGATWRSAAEFVADASGRVDLATQQPRSGYPVVDPMGLVWSLRCDARDAANPMLMRTRLDPLTIAFTAVVAGREIRTGIQRRSIGEDVRRTEVRDDGLVGTLFEPIGAAPVPGLVVLGGSGGGLSEPFAALLASHGFAALALAYFAAPGVPGDLANIPLEYFERAFGWMARRPAVRADRLAAIGSSRGGELALLLGGTFAQVRAVVAYAPSAVVYGSVRRDGGTTDPAWTYRGAPVPFLRSRGTPSAHAQADASTGAIPLTPRFLAGLEDADAVEAARIPVERIRGPVLLVGGKDDQMWPSTRYAAMIVERLARHRHPYRYESLEYTDCGHLVNFPYVPTTVLASVHSITGDLFAYGGTPEGQARAREDSWPKVLAFLRDSLA